MVIMMKIILKINIIKILENVSIIESLWMIILNSNKENAFKNKTLTGEKQAIILIYFIQTMKRLPCLIGNMQRKHYAY